MPGYVTDVAYARRFQRELSPEWLDCIALLGGVKPPERKAGFSWCDLGCGPGLTAIVLAATHLGDCFAGVDMMAEHIAQGRQLATDAGVSRLTLHHADFSGVDLGEAKFDYITAHGVYAWIDKAGQTALRSLVDRHLAPGGLLYLSYNAMPGWVSDLPFQRLVFELAAGLPGDSIERFAGAAELVQEVAAAGAPSLAASNALKHLEELRKRHSTAYLAHEYMAADWQPLFVTEVRHAMAGIGLAPVGSATFTDNFDRFSLRRIERELLPRIDDPDKRELVRDYLMHQGFRRDVYARAAPAIAEDEQRDRLYAMRYALSRPADLVEFAVRTPAGTLNFETAGARAIVEGLRNGPRPLTDMKRPELPLEDLLADVLALCCGGAVRPVAESDESVAEVNAAILGRHGSAEQIDFMALSCGTAVALEKPVLEALVHGRSRPDDRDTARWLDYLKVHAV